MKNALGRIESVLVLGGGSDIALATVGGLVANRARTVVLAGRNLAAIDAAGNELRSAGAVVTAVEFDALNLESHTNFVNDTWKRFGDFDIVILAFGSLGEQSLDERDPLAAAEVITANFTGAATVGIAVAERLRQQGHGSLVVLSSVAGERVRRANFIYGSAKAGMDGFFLGLGEALRGTGAHVMVVRPGFVHTKMTANLKAAPLAVTPDKIAADILRAISHGSELVWSPPAMRVLMSVLRHLPRVVFRRLPI